jgi:hypothetical protein
MFTYLSAVTADVLGGGDLAFLIYLFNPFTIAVCVGGSTSSIENMLVFLCLYGAAAGQMLSVAVLGTNSNLPRLLSMSFESLSSLRLNLLLVS